MSDDPCWRYAGFWPRLGALVLDGLILFPLGLLVLWGSSQWRLFEAWYLVPGLAVSLFYSVYLVRRHGGTPGKLILGIRIRRVDGWPVGYPEAFARAFPDLFLMLLFPPP